MKKKYENATVQCPICGYEHDVLDIKTANKLYREWKKRIKEKAKKS